MSENFEDIHARLEKLKIQVAINEEKTKSSLQELQEFLQSIDENFITTLSSIVPDIAILNDLSIEKIQQDSQLGDKLAELIDTLKSYLERELSSYEGMI